MICVRLRNLAAQLQRDKKLKRKYRKYRRKRQFHVRHVELARTRRAQPDADHPPDESGPVQQPNVASVEPQPSVSTRYGHQERVYDELISGYGKKTAAQRSREAEKRQDQHMDQQNLQGRSR